MVNVLEAVMPMIAVKVNVKCESLLKSVGTLQTLTLIIPTDPGQFKIGRLDNLK